MRRVRHEVRRTTHVEDDGRDVDEELRFHFEEVRRELEARGWTAAAAAAEAARRFGDEAVYRRQLAREAGLARAARRRRALWSGLWEGVWYGVRRMRRSPLLAVGIVTAFALGIGANVVLAGVLDRLLLRPPPHIRDAGSVRVLAVETFAAFRGERFASTVRSYPELRDFAAARTLSEVAGQNYTVREAVIGRGREAWRLKVLPVTGGWFGVLGVRMALGRALAPADDVVGAAPVMVISHALWRSRYGGAADVLGRTLDAGDGPRTIVGVAPPGFTGVALQRVDAWLPLVPWRVGVGGVAQMERRNAYWLEIVARLAPGATVASAEAELTALLRAVRADEIAAGRFDADGRVLATSLVPGESPNAPAEVRVAQWLGAVSLAVLLIACGNIANLLLAREARGRRDVGIRLALGVSRRRLAGGVAIEVAMLAALGALCALAVSQVLGAALERMLLPDALPERAVVGPRVLAFTAVLAALAALLSAGLPAAQSLRQDVLHALRSGVVGGARGTARLRAGLVIAQVTLSAALLCGAGLFVRSFAAARTSDLGVDVADAWYATLVLDDEGAPADVTTLVRAVDALRGVPGVRSAAASSTYPFYQQHGAPLRAEGWDSVPGRVLVHAVAGDYFDALGVAVVRGRALAASDGPGAPLVAVVNRALAERLWPEGALGRCLHIGDGAPPCTEVVGVAEDVRVGGIGADAPMQYYVPAAQQTPVDPLFTLLVRAHPGAAGLARAVEDALLAADPRVRSVEVASVAAILEPQMRPWRLGAVLFTAFGALALVVAVVGLYGVIAFDIAQRTREIGLRAALGASPGRLARMVLGRTLALGLTGVVAGTLVALLVAPRLEGLLFGVAARDPATYLSVAGLLLAAALVAGALPGARAARTDPNTALRVDV